MSDVKQTIQVTNTGLSPILSIAQGTGMVDFEFTISDFQIPAGSTAVAWNIQPTGNIVSQVCTLAGNVITVTPPAYYFLRGKNYMQIQVTGADGVNLFTFLIEVWCSPNISAPVVSQNPDLISQLMAMIGNTQDLDTTAKNNLVAAINEIYARGVVDILDTEEEIEANTDAGKATGALVTKQLISELYQETTETNSMDLVDAVNFICNNLELQKSFRKVFQCLNGWYSLDTIKSSGGICSGFLSSLTTSEAYSFYKGGADAVLKKLGDATITFKTELHSAGNTGWGITRISKPDGYSSVDAYLSQGSGSVYGYTSSDTDSPYGANLGALTTSKQTFDVSKYVEIGIQVNGNNANAHTTFY